MAKDDAVPGAAVDAGVVVVVTMDLVNSAIAEAIKGLVSSEQFETRLQEAATGLKAAVEESLKGYLSRDQFDQLSADLRGHLETVLSEALKGIQVNAAAAAAGTTGLAPLPEVPKAPKGPIDAKYLAGLRYRTSKPRKGGPGDDDSTVHVAVERDLTPDDVLDWADLGDRISFVTADGQSVKVPK